MATVATVATVATALDDIETRFGVELEICVRADGSAGCGPRFPPGTDLSKMTDEDKFVYYFTHYIHPSLMKHRPLKFPVEFGLKNEWTNEAIIYTVQEDGTHSTKKINPLEGYEIPFFYGDFTIVCGDSNESDMETVMNERSGKPIAPG